jgi:hypothetical protein
MIIKELWIVNTKIAIESNIPLPTDRKNDREWLPELPLAGMKSGQSFFLEVQDEEQIKRKLAAVRSAVRRFAKTDDVSSMFRIFRWQDEDSDKQGVRVFCVNDNGTDE